MNKPSNKLVMLKIASNGVYGNIIPCTTMY